MKGKFLRLSISLLLIIIMLSNPGILLGLNLVSFANETIELQETNNENIRFNSYFSCNDKQASDINANINSEISLIVNIEVIRDGYFYGQLNLENANFEFVDSNSIYVNTVNKDEIVLNKINSGEKVQIEIKVKPLLSNNMSKQMLSKTSVLKISGTYKNKSDKDIQIESKTELKLNFVSSDDASLDFSQEIITNKVENYQGTQMRIVQLKLNAKVNNNSYPAKNLKISIKSFENVQKPTVLYNSTLSDMNNISFIDENVNYVFYMENNEEQINFKSNGFEEIIVTFLFDEKVVLTNEDIVTTATLELHDGKILTNTSSISYTDEFIDNIIVAYENTNQSLYNSKLNIGKTLEYDSNINIRININDVAQGIVLENENLSDQIFSNIQISKQDFLEYFSSNGTIEFEVYQGSQKVNNIVVNNSSFTNNDIFEVNINATKLKITTTKPQKIGTFVIKTKKQISNNINYVNSVISGSYITPGTQTITQIEPKTNEIEIKNAITKAKVEINKESLTSVASNDDTQIKITLFTSSLENALYQNPRLVVKLPNATQKIDINSIDKIYCDDFEISNYEVKDNEIYIDLEGVDTDNLVAASYGHIISISTNITLDRTTISKMDEIVLEYTNNSQNVIYETQGQVGIATKDIKIVSPKGLITLLDIEDLGVQTIGTQNETSFRLQRNQDEKTIKVVASIVNNSNDILENVQVNGIYCNKDNKVVQIVKNATSNSDCEIISDENNYIIKIPNMENGQKIDFEYELKINSNLEYNMESNLKYDVTYVEKTSKISQNTSSTNIVLTTLKRPVLDGNIVAKSGAKTLTNEDKLRQGQVVTYITKLQNTGTEDASNIKVKTVIPDALELISNEEIVENLEQGSSKEITTIAKVKKDAQLDENIEVSSIIEYDDTTKQTNTVSNKVENGSISIRLKQEEIDEGEETLYSGANTRYVAIIENISDTKIENAKLIWNLPQEFEIENMFYQDEDITSLFTQKDGEFLPYTSNELELKTIEPNQTIEVVIYVHIKEDVKDNKQINLTCTLELKNSMFDKDTYTSNEVVNTIETLNNLDIELTANNENEYVYPGDNVNYSLRITSSNSKEVYCYLTDIIPEQLTILSTSFGEQQDNIAKTYFSIKPNETKIFNIDTVVNNCEVSEDKVSEIENTATLTTQTLSANSNSVVHNVAIKSYLAQKEDKEKEENSSSYSSSNVQTTIKNTQNISKSSISGYVFLDKNENGLYDNLEDKLENISVMLINSEDKSVINTTKTNNQGTYKFEDVTSGNYAIAFDYENSQYRPTSYMQDSSSKSSKALSVNMKLNNIEKQYGLTDEIKVDSKNVSNINLGLIQNQKFDLKLDKYISKVTVSTKNGVKNYTYDNVKLAKIELDQKELENSNVVVEYTITITNVGELAGYCKSIADYLPQDMTFVSESNSDWYLSGDCAYSTKLANQKINSGETKTLKLILNKKMTSQNLGRISNSAEIDNATNDLSIADSNSTPGNRKNGEDDYSTADLIIGLKTGSTEIIIFAVTTILIIACCIYMFENSRKIKSIEEK